MRKLLSCWSLMTSEVVGQSMRVTPCRVRTKHCMRYCLFVLKKKEKYYILEMWISIFILAKVGRANTMTFFWLQTFTTLVHYKFNIVINLYITFSKFKGFFFSLDNRQHRALSNVKEQLESALGPSRIVTLKYVPDFMCWKRCLFFYFVTNWKRPLHIL